MIHHFFHGYFDTSGKIVIILLCHAFFWTYCQIRNMRVAQRSMPGTFPPSPRVGDPNMRHGTCVTLVPKCMPGSLTSGFLWSRCRKRTFPHSRCVQNPQFYVSGKRSMLLAVPYGLDDNAYPSRQICTFSVRIQIPPWFIGYLGWISMTNIHLDLNRNLCFGEHGQCVW